MDDESGGRPRSESVTDDSSSDVDSPRDRSVPSAVLELDHVYEALAHPRRRYLCYTLLEDTEWSLTELATKIAAWELDVPERDVPPGRRTRVYVSLYHAHVPKLVDCGIVTFDEGEETITVDQHAEQVLAALEGMGASIDANQETHARSEMDDERA